MKFLLLAVLVLGLAIPASASAAPAWKLTPTLAVTPNPAYAYSTLWITGCGYAKDRTLEVYLDRTGVDYGLPLPDVTSDAAGCISEEWLPTASDEGDDFVRVENITPHGFQDVTVQLTILPQAP